jgi:hypothetical protein
LVLEALNDSGGGNPSLQMIDSDNPGTPVFSRR